MPYKNPNDLLPGPMSGPLRAAYLTKDSPLPSELELLLAQLQHKYTAPGHHSGLQSARH